MKTGKMDKKIICLLVLIAGVASVPLMTDYVIGGSSLAASLSQIKVMSQGIGKIFPIRLGTLGNMDYGYSAAAFQANTFFIIPALLHALGLGLGTAYKWTMFLCNLATAIISYVCFGKAFRKQEIGLIGSLLYTWNYYRCSEMYLVGDLGEVIAWTFLPILLLGFHILYTRNQNETCYKNVWIVFTLGFSLIAVSSTVILFVSVVMCVMFIVFMGKDALQKSVFEVLIKTCIATAMVNAWFLIPMILRLRDVSAVASLLVKDVRGMGMYVTQYLTTFPGAGGGVGLAEDGMQNAQAMGPGIAVTLLFFLALWLVFVGKLPAADSEGKAVIMLKRTMWISAVMIFLSTNLFPWDMFQNRNMLFSIMLAIMYTPAKLGIGAGIVMIFTVCMLTDILSERIKGQKYHALLLLVAGISFGTTQYLLGNILLTRGFVRDEGIEALSSIEFPLIMQESMIWRLSEVVSVVTLCGLAAMWFVRRRKSVKRV